MNETYRRIRCLVCELGEEIIYRVGRLSTLTAATSLRELSGCTGSTISQTRLRVHRPAGRVRTERE